MPGGVHTGRRDRRLEEQPSTPLTASGASPHRSELLSGTALSPPSAQRKVEGGTIAASIEATAEGAGMRAQRLSADLRARWEPARGVLRPLLCVWGSWAPFWGTRRLLHGRGSVLALHLAAGCAANFAPVFYPFYRAGLRDALPRGGGCDVAAAGSLLPEQGRLGPRLSPQLRTAAQQHWAWAWAGRFLPVILSVSKAVPLGTGHRAPDCTAGGEASSARPSWG